MPRAGPSLLAQRASSEESLDSSQDSYTPLDDEKPDAPRVVQWVGDDEFDELSTSDTEGEVGSSSLETLKRDISKLPLGALVKAHRVIKRVPQDEFNDDEKDDAASADSPEENRSEVREMPGTSTKKNKKSIEHRSNKHAPMEVTSKRPVPRRRQVVEVNTVRSRDPRFSDLSGNLSTERFRSQYGFLEELHTKELSSLKESLARARKLLISSPRSLREEREKEVKRLELAMKRAESTVNREKREDAEYKALKQAEHEEKEKRKAGKKGWWLKDADKKAIRVRARMDAIATSGGKRAVKRVIEKKQRKMGQKEKKSRPFAPPQKRKRGDDEAHDIRHKRRRMNT